MVDMTVKFDVLDQGWIPVIHRDGSRKLLGIRQTIEQAHELIEISDQSPLIEYSLYRFLGVFLMDALRPEEEEDIEQLLDAGRFDRERIEAYIALCMSEGVSFDLFDPERPFLQSKYNSELDGKEKPVATLDLSLPSGNNHTHFAHSVPTEVKPGKAAAQILSTYLFCAAIGAKGYPSGPYGAPPYFSVIKGKNLFETLVALMLPIDSISLAFDQPPVLWRSKTEVQKSGSVGSTSWLRGALFPTRRITLIPNEAGDMVRAVYFSQGENFENKAAWRDSYTTYHVRNNTLCPLRPEGRTPAWRNYYELLDIPGKHASQMLQMYQSLHPSDVVNLTLYGVEIESHCSYVRTHRHDFKLPLALADQEGIAVMKACIDAAQQLAYSLYKAMKALLILSDETRSTAAIDFDRQCERQFLDVCRNIGNGADKQAMYDRFCNDIAISVKQTFSAIPSQVRMGAKDLAAYERAKARLCRDANKLKKMEEST